MTKISAGHHYSLSSVEKSDNVFNLEVFKNSPITWKNTLCTSELTSSGVRDVDMLNSQIPYVSPTQPGGGGMGGVIDRYTVPSLFKICGLRL